MSTPSYRAVPKLGSGSKDGAHLHLIRDDAEASLCGIPRTSLGSGGALDQVVCEDCLEWFRKRRAVSGIFPRLPK
jgi:hypothetical protein